VKLKIDGPIKNSTNKGSTTHSTKRQQESKKFRWIASHVPLVRGEWSQRKGLDKPEFSFFAVIIVNDLTSCRDPFSLGPEQTLEKDRSSQSKSITWKFEIVAVECVSEGRTP
jgi:hypothetical protein